jgi:hypothetical protein
MSIKEKDFACGIILTHLFMTKGEDSTSRALMIPFFGDSCQKGGEMSPKQKDRTTTNFQFQKLNFSKSILNWYPIMFKKGRK